MPIERIDTLVVGAGQAGLAMSEHLGRLGLPHLVLERHRIAERWRSERWDSLVANGPAWHDRFPTRTFDGVDPDAFASRDDMVRYFEAHAQRIGAPVRCGVEVHELRQSDGGFRVETSEGPIEAEQVVAATGPFQRPVIPPLVPAGVEIEQIHSARYRNPDQLPPGGVLVVGAGSSGAQIAEELMRAGRRVTLSIGPHDRPPRRYRGKDFCWWLGVLGKWDMATPDPATEHVTIAVSGADGGRTVDFRRLAARGMRLVGRTRSFRDGIMSFAPDLAQNLARGDANLLSVLDEADAYAQAHGLDLPDDPRAREIDPDPPCVADPLSELDLAADGIGSIVWATGYALDFGWLHVDVLDGQGRPRHERGVSPVPGLYFLGLPWLSCRGSAFVWGVWRDAEYLARHIAGQGEAAARPSLDRRSIVT